MTKKIVKVPEYDKMGLPKRILGTFELALNSELFVIPTTVGDVEMCKRIANILNEDQSWLGG